MLTIPNAVSRFVPTADVPAMAVVLGEELSALGMLRSLAAVGIPAVVATINPDRATMWTRYGIKLRVDSYVDEDLVVPLEQLAERLRAPMVLLPTNDTAAFTVARHRDRLAERFRFRLPSYDLLVAMSQKRDFHRQAEALGCPVPRSLCLTSAADLPAIAELHHPCIIKPNRRDAAYDAKHAKAYLIDDPQESIALVRELLRTLPDIIVQEYIAGPNDAIYFCLQYRDGDGRVLSSFTGRKLRSLPIGLGITASCLGAPEAAAELHTLTNDFCGGSGILGLCSMEFKRDSLRNRFLMVEPTVGRINWQEEVATLNGVNVPATAWRDLAGLPPLPQHQATTVVGWRHSFAHWHPSWLRTADAPRFPAGVPVVDAHWRWNDPLPAVIEGRDWLLRKARGLVGGS